MSNLKIGIFVAAFIAIFVVGLIINPFVIIGAGQRGVVLNWGAVSDIILGEGIHWRIPIQQEVKHINVRTVKMEVPAAAYSKDIQTVDSKIALNYHILPDKANRVYQTLGSDFENTIIVPAVQESLKAIVAKFTAQDLIEKRENVRDDVKALLSERLTDKGIIIDAFSIMNFDFSDSYEQAVEAKQAAAQRALEQENITKQVNEKAKQRVLEAESEAKAIQIQAQAITQQGGREYVNLKAVERWNGVLPAQMIPNATLPFINLDK